MNNEDIKEEYDLVSLNDVFVCPDCGMPLIPEGRCGYCRCGFSRCS